MSIAKQIFLLLVLQLTFLSCESTDINSTDSNFSENFGAAVSRDFIGQVVDNDNHPIQSATIKIGTTSVQTDVNGVFLINGASVYEKFAYITAKKPGYIDGSRAMVPTSGKNNVRIMLLQDAPLQTIQSGVTSEVSIYSGTKVVFDGAFMDENGAAYSGAVAVSMFHLTPSDENISKLMPGMLYAQNENGQESVLETFGMMHVELRGTNGQKLQIATGHKAQITLRIDDSQLATCPSTIPLWHFDEQNGYWKQEGSATKNGNYYVGNVSHFSWWNCDIPNSSIILTINFVDENGNQLSNINATITNSIGFNVSSISDNSGQISGRLPANQNFTLKLYNPNFYQCFLNNNYYSINIGPFNSDTVMSIVVNTPNLISSNLIGSLVKCDNSSVTNGYILLERYGHSSIFPVTNGTFSIATTYCNSNANFSLKGVDYDSMQQTDLINYTFTPALTNIGNLLTCNAIDEFITYQIDNLPIKTYTSNISCKTNIYNGPANYYRILRPSNDMVYVEFIIESFNQSLGLFDTNTYTISGSDFGVNSTITNNVSFNLSSFGLINQYVDLTFNGNYNDSSGVQHTINGVVHVLRDN